MPKTRKEATVPGEGDLSRLKEEIAEIESRLKNRGPSLDERSVRLLNSRLSFLKDKLKKFAEI